jgi:hypothetical protein
MKEPTVACYARTFLSRSLVMIEPAEHNVQFFLLPRPFSVKNLLKNQLLINDIADVYNKLSKPTFPRIYKDEERDGFVPDFKGNDNL